MEENLRKYETTEKFLSVFGSITFRKGIEMSCLKTFSCVQIEQTNMKINKNRRTEQATEQV